jgi:hypothetical protein
MRRWRSTNVAAGGFAALAALAGVNEADAQTARPVRIDYEAAPGCPDARAFEEQIRARTSKVVIAPDGQTSARVRIVARGGRFDGDVVLADANANANGASGAGGASARGREHRRVEGGCGDVVAALALITALALDPTASTASDIGTGSALSAATSPGQAPPPAPPPAAAAPPPQTPKVEVPAKAGDAHAISPKSDAEPLSEEDARAHPWGFSIGAQASVTSGVAPVLVVSVPAFLDIWRRSDRLVAPALRLRFEHADSGTVTVQGLAAGADFGWTAGSIDLCPIAWAPGRMRLWPCLRGEGGAIVASGTGVSPSRSGTRAWVSVGLVVRARLTVIGSLFLEVEGGAFAPIERDRFFVEPNSTVQQAPVVAAAGAAGVGVTFW